MTKATDRIVENIERPQGGAGFMSKDELLNPEQMGSHCGLFAKITLKPNCELGYHEHHGETETYYITSGAGMYDDNGTAVAVEAGDVVFCKDGDGHGMKNNTKADLEFSALILKN